jgi:hypothetical protein
MIRKTDLIETQQRQVDDLRRGIRSEALDLADHIQRLASRVEDGSSVNPLGEVQGRGLGLDLLCARLEEARRALQSIQALED